MNRMPPILRLEKRIPFALVSINHSQAGTISKEMPAPKKAFKPPSDVASDANTPIASGSVKSAAETKREALARVLESEFMLLIL